MEKQPASSTESTLAKIEKNGKKKIQRIFKNIYFPFTWRTMFLESSKLPEIS